MTHYEEIWRFETARTAIIFDVAPEDDLDLSWDDDGSTREGLESGLYVAFVARVRCLIDGAEAGADYLGSCIYESAESFITDSSYFRDMVREAVAEARKHAAKPRLELRSVAP
jgi:hypothetical protein